MPPRYSADAYSSQYVNGSPQSNGYEGTASPAWQRNANQQKASGGTPKAVGAQSFGQAADEWRKVLTGYMRPSGNMTAAGRPAPPIAPQTLPAPYTASGIPPRGVGPEQWDGRPQPISSPAAPPPVDPAPPQFVPPGGSQLERFDYGSYTRPGDPQLIGNGNLDYGRPGGGMPPGRPPVDPAPPQWPAAPPGLPPVDPAPPQWGGQSYEVAPSRPVMPPGPPQIDPRYAPPVLSDFGNRDRMPYANGGGVIPNTVFSPQRQPLPFHESEIPQRLQRVASQFFGGNVRQAQNYLAAKGIL